ncbi:MAG: hypothetical protein IJ190_03035 [Prevotella sp.]|nr:hypothetical protein [Prevotella sp.]
MKENGFAAEKGFGESPRKIYLREKGGLGGSPQEKMYYDNVGTVFGIRVKRD